MTANQVSNPSQPKTIWRRAGNWLDRLVEPSAQITEPGTRRQVQLQTAFILALITLFLVGTLFTWQVDVRTLRPETISQFTSTLVLLAAYWLSRTRRYELGVILIVTSLSLSAFAIALVNPTGATTIFYAFIPLTYVIGGFLLRTSYAAVLVAVDTLIIFSMPLFRPVQITFRDIAAEGGVTMTLGILLIVFSAVRNLTERDRLAVLARANQELQELKGSLEVRVEERTAQLRASAEVGRAAASILDTEQLLQQTVDLIIDRFGFYYAAIFTPDAAGQSAILRAASPGNRRSVNGRYRHQDTRTTNCPASQRGGHPFRQSFAI
jgi:hypothetical protein